MLLCGETMTRWIISDIDCGLVKPCGQLIDCGRRLFVNNYPVPRRSMLVIMVHDGREEALLPLGYRQNPAKRCETPTLASIFGRDEERAYPISNFFVLRLLLAFNKWE